jgi:hypothetical protein
MRSPSCVPGQQGTSLLTVPPGTQRLAGAFNCRSQPVAFCSPKSHRCGATVGVARCSSVSRRTTADRSAAGNSPWWPGSHSVTRAL